MPIEGEDIDDMLYAVYLHKLESLKGTKKPLVDFIKEMAENSNNFHNLTYRQFQLVTRAIHYCSAVNPLSVSLLNNLSTRLITIIRNNATEENILELLEHYKKRVLFHPSNIEQFIHADKMYNILLTERPDLSTGFSISNTAILDRFRFLAYTAIHKHNPHSKTLLLFNERASKDELDKAKAYLADLTELLEYNDKLINGDIITCN